MSRFADYFAATRDRGRNPFYDHLDPLLVDVEPGHVVELGAGVSPVIGEWLEKGWQVTAVDSDAEAVAYIHETFPSADVIEVSFPEMRLPPCDLVCAVFSLFFTPPEGFESVWQKIEQSVKPGGLFAGQLLGVNDDWASQSDITSLTRGQVEELLSNWEILMLDEVDRDGKTATGADKHWHVYHIIAQKRTESG